MSDEEVLKKEEIDALLGEGNDQECGDPSKPKSFDFTKQDRIVRGRMPTLEMIGDRFIRNFKLSLYHMLRKTAEITSNPIKIVKFNEYVSTFPKPTSFNIVHVSPLRGKALFVMDGGLVSSLTETFFGGDGKIQKQIEEREFTPAEIRITSKFLEIIFNDLADAWKPIYPVEYEFLNSEMNPGLAKIVSPNELVVVSSFRIELETGPGEFHVALPYSMVEPIRDILDAGVQSDRDQKDDRWVDSIQAQVVNAEIELSCILTELEVSLKDIINFKKGDVLNINMPDKTRILAEDVPIFNAKFGVHEGKYAAKILQTIHHEESKS